MKTLNTMILSAGVVALLGASGLYAQTKATADIPFDFTVKNITLPAGAYTIASASPVKNLLYMRNNETRREIMLLASAGQSAYRGKGAKNVLVFHEIGGRYFLSEVKTDAVCGSVGKSKLERELESEGSGHPMAAVIVPALSNR